MEDDDEVVSGNGELGEVEDFQSMFDSAQKAIDEKTEKGDNGKDVAPEGREGLPMFDLSGAVKSKSSPDGDDDKDEAPKPKAKTEKAADKDDEEEPKEDSEEEDSEGEEDKSEADESSPEVAELKKLAKKLGFEVDDRQVAPQERAKWRHHKREQRRILAEEKEIASRELESLGSKLEGRYARYAEMEKALEAGDVDAVAKAMGYESWLDVNRSHIARQTNPGYKKQKELEEKLARIEREEANRTEAARQAQMTQRQQRAQQEYREEVAEWVENSSDPTVKAFQGDQDFIGAIIALQEKHYDPDERSTITVAQAAKLADRSARDMLKKLNRIYGKRAASEEPDEPADEAIVEKPTSGATAGKKKTGRKPPKTVSQKQAAEASGKKGSSMSDDEFFAMGIEQMRQANSSS